MGDWLHRKANQLRFRLLWLILVHDERCVVYRSIGMAYLAMRRRWEKPSQELPYVIGSVLNVAERPR